MWFFLNNRLHLKLREVIFHCHYFDITNVRNYYDKVTFFYATHVCAHGYMGKWVCICGWRPGLDVCFETRCFTKLGMLADQTILEKLLSPPPSTRLKVCATTLFTRMLGTQFRSSYLWAKHVTFLAFSTAHGTVSEVFLFWSQRHETLNATLLSWDTFSVDDTSIISWVQRYSAVNRRGFSFLPAHLKA